MAKVNISVLFKGNCEEAFNFYKSIFGGEFLSLIRYSDIPSYKGPSEKEKNKIENVSLALCDNTILMGADVSGPMAKMTNFGNNFSIYLEAENKEEADKLYQGLSEGGKILMPLAIAHWGDYFGMFTDKFGINWQINLSRDKE